MGMQTEQGALLPRIARGAIARTLTTPDPANAREVIDEDMPLFKERGACFVTLTQKGVLRGCIGTLQACRSLLVDVQYNAISAAIHDSRFLPVTLEEFPEITVEVCVLSTPQPLSFGSQSEVLALLRPGLDGVVFEYESHRATFLPQVWENLPQPKQFLAMLKQKAGLPANFWAEGIRISRYHVTKWHEIVREH
jgi:AmmeMemoRadiSam system protein A